MRPRVKKADKGKASERKALASNAKKNRKTKAIAPAVEDDDDDEELEEEEEEEEEEDDDDEEEESDEDVSKSFPLGSEAMAVNLKDKKHLQHNKKVGVVKKVDAANRKIYLQMKASGARLVLKSENVVPVDHSKTKKKPKRTA